MYLMDNFLHSTYLQGKKCRVAVRKNDIRCYEEIEGGTALISRESKSPLFITMPYDEVKNQLTLKVC